MMNNDLISRSALVEKIGTETYYSIDPYNRRGKIREMVALAPAVDAVEVVRCRDCEHWTELRNYVKIGNCDRFVCSCTPGSFFCADGKRKIDAEVEGNA